MDMFLLHPLTFLLVFTKTLDIAGLGQKYEQNSCEQQNDNEKYSKIISDVVASVKWNRIILLYDKNHYELFVETAKDMEESNQLTLLLQYEDVYKETTFWNTYMQPHVLKPACIVMLINYERAFELLIKALNFSNLNYKTLWILLDNEASIKNYDVFQTESISKLYAVAVFDDLIMPISEVTKETSLRQPTTRVQPITSSLKVLPDFRGKYFKVVTIELAPFQIKTVDRITGNITYKGISFEILHSLAEYFNFRYEVTEPSDGDWGLQLPNGSWTGMINMIMNQEVDIGVASVSINTQRAKVVDFLQHFWMESGTFLMRMPAEDRTFISFRPFKGAVWVCFGAGLILIALTLGIIEHFTFTSHIRLNVYDTLLYTVATAWHQGSPWTPRKTSTRLVWLCWWLYCVIFIGVYTGNLIAFLSVSRINFPINSLDDLAAHTEIDIGVQAGTAFVQLFENSNDGIYNKLNQRLSGDRWANDVHSVDDYVQRVLEDDNFMYIEELTALRQLTSNDCRYKIADDRFHSIYFGFPVQNGFPYKELFDTKIMQMLEAGLVEEWYKKYKTKQKNCLSHSVKDKIPISFSDIEGLVISFVSGIGLALTAFLAERYRLRITKILQENTTLYRYR